MLRRSRVRLLPHGTRRSRQALLGSRSRPKSRTTGAFFQHFHSVLLTGTSRRFATSCEGTGLSHQARLCSSRVSMNLSCQRGHISGRVMPGDSCCFSLASHGVPRRPAGHLSDGRAARSQSSSNWGRATSWRSRSSTARTRSRPRTRSMAPGDLGPVHRDRRGRRQHRRRSGTTIQTRLADGFLNDPIVSLSVVEINSLTLSVSGMVRRPAPSSSFPA